ncbi:hypothetical protein ABEB36_008962 [Hypothenemus hampei]|uniref:Uncharacterized protein n=1 Tax=Hypothenemus hampei TaxID=57062 RepID=A0ABD1ENM9_HYPHA
MQEFIISNTWKKVFVVIFVSGCILLTISYYDYAALLNYQTFVTRTYTKPTTTEEPTEVDVHNEDKRSYLVSSTKCKILDLDPFSEDAKKYFKPLKYKTCTKNDLLTYVTKEDNIATIHIDLEVIRQYTKGSLSCCYSNITRSTSPKNPDDSIKISNCKEFHNNVTIMQEAVLVKCSSKNTKVYENVHTSVRITKDVQKKISSFDNTTNQPISVLFVGVDSISRLNFRRALPNTFKFVEDHKWVSLNGYNKIDDNTFPNLMAILTGFDQLTAYKVCNPKVGGSLDKCPMLWYSYRDLGYVTGYAEDAASISTFNYLKKGFIKPPTDYYFRPYVMATEKLNKMTVSSMAYCTGPETSGERIMNLVKDFGATFKQNPHFGFFWMNTFSHNDISTPTMMDNKLKNFLTNLDNSGITNNSLIIFLSDHGIRFGDIRLTETGWLEERLPYIYFSFPPWFKQRFPNQYNNFLDNANKLTTPYDLHMTLQDILTMSQLNYTIKPSDACPKCMSLFEKIPQERSCEDANITHHWCTCSGYNPTKLDSESESRLKQVITDKLNNILLNKADVGGDKCSIYTVDEISTRISQKFSYKKIRYVLVTVKTNPKAVFETTISYTGDIVNSTLEIGPLSRLDYYAPHTYCVADAYLKKYCYCK